MMPSSDRKFKMNEVLRELSLEIGADYKEGEGPYIQRRIRLAGLIHSYGVVHAHVAPWTVTIASYTDSREDTFTQMYVPYVNPDGFRFWIARRGTADLLFCRLVKKLGLGKLIDVVGFPEFDEAFAIAGNNKGRVRTLFADPKFRGLIQAQPTFRMEVRDKPWSFAIGAEPSFPENVDVLLFEVLEAITDVGQLKTLFDAFIATLEQLCQLGSAQRVPPGVEPWGLFGVAMPVFGRSVRVTGR